MKQENITDEELDNWLTETPVDISPQFDQRILARIEENQRQKHRIYALMVGVLVVGILAFVSSSFQIKPVSGLWDEWGWGKGLSLTNGLVLLAFILGLQVLDTLTIRKTLSKKGYYNLSHK